MTYDPLAERILRRTVDPVFHPMQDSNGLWFIEIPTEGDGGLQVFRGTDLKSLCSTLAKAQWNATQLIRLQAQQLRDCVGVAETEAERRFAARQEQGLYDEL
jgi:hypothetical protein